VAWIAFVFHLYFFFLLGKIQLVKLTGCLILTAGLGNTPLFRFSHNTGLIWSRNEDSHIDQPGTFVVLSLGILVALYLRGEQNGEKNSFSAIYYFIF
jgi:hypothetical protein